MIGVHVCEVCGAVFDTIGGFLNHMEEAHGLVPDDQLSLDGTPDA